MGDGGGDGARADRGIGNGLPIGSTLDTLKPPSRQQEPPMIARLFVAAALLHLTASALAAQGGQSTPPAVRWSGYIQARETYQDESRPHRVHQSCPAQRCRQRRGRRELAGAGRIPDRQRRQECQRLAPGCLHPVDEGGARHSGRPVQDPVHARVHHLAGGGRDRGPRLRRGHPGAEAGHRGHGGLRRGRARHLHCRCLQRRRAERDRERRLLGPGRRPRDLPHRSLSRAGSERGRVFRGQHPLRG